jgi:hypothetical protein
MQDKPLWHRRDMVDIVGVWFMRAMFTLLGITIVYQVLR